MKLAACNIALTPYDHGEELRHLPELGLEGLEVAPSRVWRDTWDGLSAADVERYRAAVEAAGLSIIGLHSLFWDHPSLGLFRGAATRAKTLEFLVHLSKLCRDLGGRTLIYGSAPARARGEMSAHDATREAIDFFAELCPRIESHGTCYCFEPLAPEDGDFIHTVRESRAVVEAVDHPALRLQIDAKALVANEEVGPEVFRDSAPYLVHFHANEPGMVALGDTGQVNHAVLGQYLHDVAYDGFVSIEQRMLDDADPLPDLARSARVLRECYR